MKSTNENSSETCTPPPKKDSDGYSDTIDSDAIGDAPMANGKNDSQNSSKSDFASPPKLQKRHAEDESKPSSDGDDKCDNSKDNEDHDKNIVSILNLVVDHVMMPPSPLEEDEFKWKLERNKKRVANENGQELSQESDFIEEDIQVPVIRIFGPIIRGRAMPNPNGNGNGNITQNTGEGRIRQSGCVHIHGAYPYLLARPVKAGPDGSSYIYRACRGDRAKKVDFKIDWDDADSVALIVDDIHLKLENALRSSLEHASSPRKQDPHPTNNSSQLRFIRQVTVVCGRGFYTFCNGPIAPFFRVEYYNPTHRWRVKIMLERGFDMPIEYHPEGAKCMQNAGQKSTSMDDIEIDVMKFRCYEAHIPYTMQFFKVSCVGWSYPSRVHGGWSMY